jgi:hypothetical protein
VRQPVVLLLLAAAIGCGITGPENVTLHVQGTVTDAATGVAVSGATVHMYPPTLLFGTSDGDITSTTSDAQGHYVLSTSVKGPCIGNGFGLAVSATTSNPNMEADAVTIECSAAQQTVDLALKPVTP